MKLFKNQKQIKNIFYCIILIVGLISFIFLQWFLQSKKDTSLNDALNSSSAIIVLTNDDCSDCNKLKTEIYDILNYPNDNRLLLNHIDYRFDIGTAEIKTDNISEMNQFKKSIGESQFNNKITINGQIATPIVIEMNKENNKWKISNVIYIKNIY